MTRATVVAGGWLLMAVLTGGCAALNNGNLFRPSAVEARPPIALSDTLPPGATAPRAVHTTPLILPLRHVITDFAARIRVRVAVDPGGHPRQVEIIHIETTRENRALLAESARRTVSAWRFEAAKVGDQTIAAWHETTLVFDTADVWKALYDAPDLTLCREGTTPARFMDQPDPPFPRGHPRANDVVVRYRMGADGRVHQTWIARSSGNREIDLATAEAVRQWSGKPARGPDGEVMSIIGQVCMKYRRE